MALYAKSLHWLLLIVSIMLLLLLFFPSLFLFSERLSKLKTIHLLFWKAGYQLKFIFFRLSFFIANFDTTSVKFSSVQSLSRVPLFETLLTATHQASPVHHQLPGFTQTHVHRVGDAIQPSHPLSSPFSSCPQSLPASGSFPMSQLFTWGGQSTGVSASASVPSMNTQDWPPLGWTGWISLQSKRLSRVFSNTTVQKHQFSALSFLHSPNLTSIHDQWKNHSLD